MKNELATMIALSKLVDAPENVRKTNTQAGHDGLKASLLADGVLQNLVVYDMENGKFAVTAGGRRRRALAALAKEKKIAKTYEVPCLVKPRDEAVALSLAENVEREDMHPADEFEAFAALIDQGRTVEDVAARYGVTPAVVERRLKLARVAPAILTAYREDRMTLDAVMGFTVSEDHAEQQRVFDEIEARGGRFDRAGVVRMLTHQKVATDDKRFLYVGEDAYLAAGGTISRDLFDAEGGGYADDSGLLDRLALAKLAEEAPALLAQGWKWIEPSLDYDYSTGRGFARIHTRYRPLSAEDEARSQALAARLDEIAEETGGTEPHDEALAEECERIEAELEEIEARQHAYDPAEMALAGGWLTLDNDGTPSPELGYVKREDVQALDALRQARMEADEADGEADADEGDEAEVEDEEAGGELYPVPSPADTAGLSDALLTDLHAARTVALRLELTERPDLALRAVAHALAGRLIASGNGVLTVAASQTYIPAIAATHCPSDEPLKARIGHWRLRLPGRADQLWPAILRLDDDSVLDLIAVCAAMSVDATYSKGGEGAQRRRMEHADQLAQALDLDMTKHWTATGETFFGRVSKDMIREAVAEAAGPEAAEGLAKMKKAEMVAEAAKLTAGTGWLPKPLRNTDAAVPARSGERRDASAEAGEAEARANAAD